MAEVLPPAVQRLVKVLAKLPGVGNRTAMRFVLHLIREGESSLDELSGAVSGAREEVGLCPLCYALSERTRESCRICAEPLRETGSICVVETIGDLVAIESTGLYRGRYFVFHRLLSPLKGIGPADIHVDQLVKRVRDEGLTEVVLATPLTTDGETTATFLNRLLGREGVRVTRLAAGVPVGGAIEYLDRMTLSRAFEDRKEI